LNGLFDSIGIPFPVLVLGFEDYFDGLGGLDDFEFLVADVGALFY
jgi:hypothetical protein